MEAYKERLVKEFKDLAEKISKLGAFINKLDVEQYEGQKQLLTRQYYVMCDYIIILERRAVKEDINLNNEDAD